MWNSSVYLQTTYKYNQIQLKMLKQQVVGFGPSSGHHNQWQALVKAVPRTMWPLYHEDLGDPLKAVNCQQRRKLCHIFDSESCSYEDLLFVSHDLETDEPWWLGAAPCDPIPVTLQKRSERWVCCWQLAKDFWNTLTNLTTLTLLHSFQGNRWK